MGYVKFSMDSCFKQPLNEELRVNSLHNFLNEGTRYFDFGGSCYHDRSIKSILEMIPRISPNIETINFTRMRLNSDHKEMFITLFKTCRNLKSLRVNCGVVNRCLIKELLIKDDFTLHDQDLQNALKKIDHLGCYMHKPKHGAQLLKLLPNLKSLEGTCFGPVLSDYVTTCAPAGMALNITKIMDIKTSYNTFENFFKFCPKLKSINLIHPGKKIIINLWKFPELVEINLSHFEIKELKNLLKICGHKITKLKLKNKDISKINKRSIKKLCPGLEKLKIEKI